MPNEGGQCPNFNLLYTSLLDEATSETSFATRLAGSKMQCSRTKVWLPGRISGMSSEPYPLAHWHATGYVVRRLDAFAEEPGALFVIYFLRPAAWDQPCIRLRWAGILYSNNTAS